MHFEVKDNLCGDKLGKKQKLILPCLKLSTDLINKKFHSEKCVPVGVYWLSARDIQYRIYLYTIQ